MINNVVIMTIDKRVEMARELEQQCLDHGWNPQLYISGDGSDVSLEYDNLDPPMVGCEEFKYWKWGTGESAWRHFCAFRTHQKIIKTSLKRGLDNIMLLEDDAIILSRFDNVVNQIWSQVPTAWDIIYLGWHAFEYESHKFAGMNLRREEKYKEDGKAILAPIKQCGGLFGALINRSLFARILNMAPISPVDSQLNYMRDSIVSLNVIPMVIYVKTCFSNCEQIFIERNSL